MKRIAQMYMARRRREKEINVNYEKKAGIRERMERRKKGGRDSVVEGYQRERRRRKRE